MSNFHCEMCELAKHYRSSYSPSTSSNTSHLLFIHYDMLGLAPIASLFGYRYFVTFINDYSKVTWIYVLKSKHEVFFSLLLVSQIS